MRFAGALLVVLLGAAVSVASGADVSPETRYVARLRATTAEVAASAREVAALPSTDAAELGGAGKRLEAAAASACQTLRAYRNATTRYGTDEEYRLFKQLVGDLKRARSRFGTLAGFSLPAPTAKQRSTAEQALRAYARTAAKKKVNQWIKDERLAALLTSGNLKTVRARLEQEVARRIEATAKKLSLQATGIAISLDVPLRKQAQAAAEQSAVNWLAKTVFKTSPNAFVVQLVSKPIVRFLRTELKAMLRNHKNVEARTDRTLKGFANREAQLQRLIDTAATARLATVRGALATAQRALNATAYLKSDLRKQSRSGLLKELKAGESGLLAKIRDTREAFLLDSKLARTDLRALADSVCKVRGEVGDLNKALQKGKKGGSCTVSLRTVKGKPGVTGTFTLSLKPNPALSDKRVQPFVTATTSGTGGDEDHVPVLFKLWFHKKGSDATFMGIGDARGLDFNSDSAAGRRTPEKIEGMFVGVSEQEVRANSPFQMRLFLTAFDEKKRSVWTELVGTCNLS